MSLNNLFNLIAKHNAKLVALLAVVAAFSEFPPMR